MPLRKLKAFRIGNSIMFSEATEESSERKGEPGAMAPNISWPRVARLFARSARCLSPPPISRAEHICRMRIG
jgi:hypothetical protein